MSASLIPSIGSDNFITTVQSVLVFLKNATDFDILVFTRPDSDDIITATEPDSAVVEKKNAYLTLVDLFCTYVVKGEGACCATKPSEFSVYAQTESFKALKLESYIAVPVAGENGKLFGTLCALNRATTKTSVKSYLPMMETFAASLSAVLNAETNANHQADLAKNAASDSIMDTITPLYNRRGWDHMTAIEEERARKYNHPLSVISIDLDNLKKINDTYGHAKGGEYISKAGKAIKDTIRPYDIGSRTGGDEFNILLIECDDIQAEKIAGEMKIAFAAGNISGSFGVAQMKHSENMAQTMDRADQKMYEDKRIKKAKSAA